MLHDPRDTGMIEVHNVGVDFQSAHNHSYVRNEQKRSVDQSLVALENVLCGTKSLDDVSAQRFQRANVLKGFIASCTIGKNVIEEVNAMEEFVLKESWSVDDCVDDRNGREDDEDEGNWWLHVLGVISALRTCISLFRPSILFSSHSYSSS